MGSTAAGSALAISAALPSIADQAGYAALTYLDIGSLEKIGTYGASPVSTEFQPLRGPIRKYKGPVDYGALQPSLMPDEEDAGQALLHVAAEELHRQYSFRVILADGGVRYFQGRVFGFLEDVEGAETLLTGASVVEINTPIVKATTAQPLPDGFEFVTTNDGADSVTTSGGFERVTSKVN